MTGTATRPDLAASATVTGVAALALALLILRCLPLRLVLAVARALGHVVGCPAPEPVALGAVASCQRAARWYPGRAACLENSLAAFIALALRGYRADWCIGCRLGPAEAHAWIETASGPVGEADRSGRPLHVTGTGLTGALLAELVGPSGQVVSVDIDQALIRRAAELHAERRIGNITLATGDGNQGAPGHGPFDVIIAWATPAVIPRAWPTQAKAGAVICTPVYFAETAKSSAHVRATVTASGGLADITLGEASYVDMGGKVNTSFGIPMFYLDATQEDSGDKPTWISVAWRGRHPGHEPRRSLEMLTAPAHREPYSLADGDKEHRTAWRDFRAYCAARDNSTNLTSHGTIDGSTAIGFSSGNNAAVLSDDGAILGNAADSPALAKLRDYLNEWDHDGRIGLTGMTPVAENTSDGWAVRLCLPTAAER